VAQDCCIPPILIAEKPTVTFEALKDGKLRATYQTWEDARVALPGEWFELRWSPQGVMMRKKGTPR
jgi:hypothetical protein